MWSRVWASFGPADFSAHKRGPVHNERTTLWEKKGNDAADEFAKRGASIHGVSQTDYHMWRGLVALAREAARWSGELHALVGGGVECQDHADLMEAYSASLEECEADAAPASLPEPAPAEQATPPLFDAAAGWVWRTTAELVII